VVLGMMGRSPFGGQTWLYLNWLRGFERLGHDVYYVEDDSVWPYHPGENAITDDCSYAVRHIADSLARVGLADRWAFRVADPASRSTSSSGRLRTTRTPRSSPRSATTAMTAATSSTKERRTAGASTTSGNGSSSSHA